MDMERVVFVIFLSVRSCYAVESVRFLALGDWGGLPLWPYTTPFESSVAKQMAAVTERYQSHFNIALGDNFYLSGVKNVDDTRFKDTFEDVFHYPSLHNPWYILAGNHDHYGNVSAQIAYSNKSKRWNFPDFYYDLHLSIPGGGVIDILMLDTVLLCGNTDHNEYGGQPKQPLDKSTSEDQLTWIKTQLQKSKADYLIVAGHFPVYSIAEHGPTKCLLEKLKPLLYKYNVSAYLSGHDHNLQHISSAENGHTVEYIVSGAANVIDWSKGHLNDIPKGSLKFHWADVLGLGGFAYIEATTRNMTLTFVDGLNKHLYQYSFPPRYTRP